MLSEAVIDDDVSSLVVPRCRAEDGDRAVILMGNLVLEEHRSTDIMRSTELTTRIAPRLVGSLLAVNLIALAGTVGAVETLGPNETPAALFWLTQGGVDLVDADVNGVAETIDPSGSSSTILPGTLTLVILDVVTYEVRDITVDQADPFWMSEFLLQPVALQQEAVPETGSEAVIPYLGQYGVDLDFASQLDRSDGFLSGLLFTTSVGQAAENTNLEVAGLLGQINCCSGYDLQRYVTTAPSADGLWLDLDRDSVADSNVERLIDAKGLSIGDVTWSITNIVDPRDRCELLPNIRGECEPLSRTLTTTNLIPLLPELPEPDDCDLNQDDQFGLQDIRIFVSACREGTVLWDCDLDESGEFSVADVIRFATGCL